MNHYTEDHIDYKDCKSKLIIGTVYCPYQTKRNVIKSTVLRERYQHMGGYIPPTPSPSGFMTLHVK